VSSNSLVPRLSVCPICSNGSLAKIHHFTAAETAEGFFPVTRNEARHAALRRNLETLWGASTCEVVQCASCRFVFPIPYVAGDQEFYELAYGVPAYPGHRWEYDRALDFLRAQPSTAAPLRLLELGAGFGNFIKPLLKIPGVRPDRIVATDYLSHSVDALRRLGVEARMASVFDIATNPSDRGSFDAIFAFQSIEHMANITEVFDTLRSLLKPGGFAALSVPNGPSVEFFEQRLQHYDWPPNHVGRWYLDTFKAIASKAGFELVAHDVEPPRKWLLVRDAMIARVHAKSSANPQGIVARAQSFENRTARRIFSLFVGTLLLVPFFPEILRTKFGSAQIAILRKPA
jgi:SAM-dependent methyltransferase